MSLKLGGFVCDKCSIFTTFEGVASNSNDIDNIFSDDGEKLNNNLIFAKVEGWYYYNVDECTHMGTNWIRWNKESICLCSKCDRKLKLEKLISKI